MFWSSKFTRVLLSRETFKEVKMKVDTKKFLKMKVKIEKKKKKFKMILGNFFYSCLLFWEIWNILLFIESSANAFSLDVLFWFYSFLSFILSIIFQTHTWLPPFYFSRFRHVSFLMSFFLCFLFSTIFCVFFFCFFEFLLFSCILFSLSVTVIVLTISCLNFLNKALKLFLL